MYFNNQQSLRFDGSAANSTSNNPNARGLAHSKHRKIQKRSHFRTHRKLIAEKQSFFALPKNTIIKYPKKIGFLLCCEPVLFRVFDAQYTVQFEHYWPSYWSGVLICKCLVIAHVLFLVEVPYNCKEMSCCKGGGAVVLSDINKNRG